MNFVLPAIKGPEAGDGVANLHTCSAKATGDGDASPRQGYGPARLLEKTNGLLLFKMLIGWSRGMVFQHLLGLEGWLQKHHQDEPRDQDH